VECCCYCYGEDEGGGVEGGGGGYEGGFVGLACGAGEAAGRAVEMGKEVEVEVGQEGWLWVLGGWSGVVCVQAFVSERGVGGVGMRCNCCEWVLGFNAS